MCDVKLPGRQIPRLEWSAVFFFSPKNCVWVGLNLSCFSMLKELYVVKLNDRNGVVEVIQSPGEISIRKLGEMQFFFNKPFVLISIS